MANDWRDGDVVRCDSGVGQKYVVCLKMRVADVDDNLRRGLFIASDLVVLVLQVDSSLVTDFIQNF